MDARSIAVPTPYLIDRATAYYFRKFDLIRAVRKTKCGGSVGVCASFAATASDGKLNTKIVSAAVNINTEQRN